jgi:cephalosporin hydroxylase
MPHRNAILAACLVVLCAGCQRRQSAAVSEIQVADAAYQSRLLRGFYDGTEGWKWTARVFAVSLDPLPPEKSTYLELDLAVPAELLSEYPDVTVIGRVNGIEIGRATYFKPGRYVFAHYVPLPALQRSPAEVEFELDRWVKEPKEGKVMGLIALAVGLKEYEQTTAYREARLGLAQEGFRKLLEQRRLQVPPDKAKELLKLFHALPVWENMWFQNVRLIKNPLDLWMMQQIIYEVQPEFIVETGSWYGGSALYFAHTLNGMGLTNSRVLTVDIGDYIKAATAHPLWKKYIEFFHGSSTDPAIVSQIARRVKGRKTIVTLDSDHSMKHVLEELRMYSPLVTSGSYLVVEDTHLDGIPTHPEQGPGPYAAVQRFLEEGGTKDFEQDFSRELLVMTFNPGGWLRRK